VFKLFVNRIRSLLTVKNGHLNPSQETSEREEGVFYDSYHKIARIQFSNTILWILKKLVTIAKDINQIKTVNYHVVTNLQIKINCHK